MPNVMLSVSVMKTMNNKDMRAVKPDSNGVYKGLPLGVIGQASRNGSEYDVESMVFALSNPASIFYKKLTEGNLRGEYGHPVVKDKSDIIRIAQVDPKCISHAITGIQTKKGEGYTMIYGDIKPCGPYGKYLKETLEDDQLTTSFSLRSLCDKPTTKPGNIQYKVVRALVTFDAVDMPGFEMASDRYAMEAKLDVSDKQQFGEVCECLGIEANMDQFYEMLGTDKVAVPGYKYLNIDEKGNIYTNGKRESTFHNMWS
jgi:hypothetical protein